MKVNPPRTVVLPDTGRTEQELLLLLKGRTLNAEDCYRILGDRFGLNAAQLHARRRTRSESAWNNRVQSARNRLVKRGLLFSAPRGVWRLTTAGKQAADELEMLRATPLSELL